MLVPASGSEVITTAASDSEAVTNRPTAASDNEVPAVIGHVNLCTQHHTVLSLERSLSISAVGYLHSSGSVLADSCVKGCSVCAHTFVRITFCAQRQALNRPLFQHVSACYTHNSRAGYCLALGFAVCARTCVHKLIRARSYVVIPQIRDSYGVLAANKNELAARAFERVSVLVLVLWSWALML